MEDNESPTEETDLQSTETEQPEPEVTEPEGPLDLESVEKFRFAGREWTHKELQDSYLMQADYTRKTQELAEERKYMGALQADLEAVKKNPALATEFKKLYPEKYHSYLGYVYSEKQGQGSKQAISPEIAEKLDKMEQFIEQQTQREEEVKVDAWSNQLKSWEDEFTKKYDLSNPLEVWTRIQTSLDENQISENQVTKQYAESLFKNSQKFYEEKFDSRQTNQFKQNRQINSSAKDVGKGGGLPGNAPRALKFHEVQDQLVEDLRRKGL